MSALLTAQLYSPAAIIVCDMDENRLKLAKELGATHTISPASGDVSKQVFAIVGEDGVDCAIEAVGIPATWNMCQDIVKPGGHIAVVRFKFSELEKAYDVFKHAAENQAMKVVLEAD